MNMNLEAVESGNLTRTGNQQTNIGRTTTSQSTSFPTGNVENRGYAIDISGTVMDNKAYAGHGRTTEEVMQDAGQQDIATMRDYMTVMSNTMSTEDFARLEKDGTLPDQTDVGTVVTIVDHIKAALMKGGTEVAGYTDTMDQETLTKITGNQVMAQELEQQFKQLDLPITEENVQAVTDASQMAGDLTELSDGAKKYLIQNQMEPTIEHLYIAQHAAKDDGSRQANGYYTEETPGYYAKKAENQNLSGLQPQMEQVILESGYPVNQETLSESTWLVEKGVPLTTEALTSLHEINKLQFPLTEKQVVEAASAAIADGHQALAGNLSDPRSIYEKADDAVIQIAAITDQAVSLVVEQGQLLNLQNLIQAQAGTGQNVKENRDQNNKQDTQQNLLSARRLLEETRLAMTTEANLQLLRRGISIDTAPLQELVDQLKLAESSYQKQLMGTQDQTEAVNRMSNYQNTISKLEEIPFFPVDIVGKLAGDSGYQETLDQVYDAGSSLKATYEKAGLSYETLMTEPRRDLGDSIQKAFRNVDTILQDMGQELSDENRRAVRILGYNSMEITESNLEQIKDMDQLLTGVVDKCKPGAVLQMIRDGVNPMTMSLEDLNTYLEDNTDCSTAKEDYASFLYQLEQKQEITSEERNAYIGIYRLIRQIEKQDDAAVGSIAQTGAEYSFRNLLSAHRSSKKQGMNITTGTENDQIPVLSKSAEESSISAQIDAGYQTLRTLQNTPDKVLETLLTNHQEITADHIVAATGLMEQADAPYRKLADLEKKQNEKSKVLSGSEISDTDTVEQAIDALQSKITDRESTQEAFLQLQNSMETILADAVGNSRVGELDIRALSQTFKQLQLVGNFSNEERYEAPVNLNGEITKVSLKIVHDGSQSGRVSCYTDTEAYGKIGAQFQIENGVLSGYIVCNDTDGLNKLKEKQQSFLEQLDLEEEQKGSINYIVSDRIDSSNFLKENKDSKQECTPATDRELYRVAKSFLIYLQDTAS